MFTEQEHEPKQFQASTLLTELLYPTLELLIYIWKLQGLQVSFQYRRETTGGTSYFHEKEVSFL